MDDNARIESERKKFRRQLANINDLEDPLDIYDQYVQWTLQTYGERSPNSGLLDLLGQATRAFINDPIYKADLRYLKIWALYAGQVARPTAIDIYADLLAKEIGTSFSLLYEGYAALLEVDGRWKDAEIIYRRGIQRQARPLERLKKRYQEFRSRNPLTKSKVPQRANDQGHSGSSLRSASSSSSQTIANFEDVCTPESRYKVMLAPPNPGSRPERYHFDMSLLYTKESGEYCIQEARARAMGLLGKKWPPPPSEQDSFLDASSESTIMPTDFNDDDLKSMGRQGMFEPTVTINTREALEDVFGMYNSPDRTRVLPGSKNAPLKQVRLSSAGITPRTPAVHNDENAQGKGRTQAPTPAFRPFVDENAQSGRTPSVKISPFNDENKASPSTALSSKDSSLNPEANSSKAKISGSLFSSKVFTPAQTKFTPLRDVFTAEVHEESQHDPSSEPNGTARAFVPFVDEDVKTPFKVFSRPPEQSEIAFTPKTPSGAFTPFVDPKPAFTPFRDAAPAFTPYSDQKLVPQPLQPRPLQAVDETSVDQDQEPTDSDDIEDEEDEEDDPDTMEQGQYEVPPQHISDAGFEEEDSYEQIPLGGRFGRFNVMTPITERTFEFTTSTRGSATPSERLQALDELDGRRLGNVFTPQHRDEHGAVIAAEKLAAELREEEEHEGNEPLEPLHLSPYLPPNESPGVAVIEEKAGAMSLGDSLTLGAQFKPPNPCNPFDPPIVKNLLSRIPSDPHFYDLRDQESNLLDGLQKFAKKSRKTSGSGNTGTLDVTACFSLELDGHKFSVLEKLGEGGFGAVFKARDIGASAESEFSDDDLDEDDEESLSMVALKVVKPRNTWEYHVLRRLHSVIPVSLRRSIILPHALYGFRDESFLVLDLCHQGTLLSIVNNAAAAGVSQQGACLDELLVIFFTVELLRLLEAMHKAGFIHGDLKIDNCLLRLEDVPGGAAAWSSAYSASGDGGWSYKGLKVIDFGRTIDKRLFPQGQQFIADWPTDDRDCFEARENRPWTFQTDYFGLVGIIYCMLFGKYITASAINSSSGTHKLSTPLKRYWQTDLWNRLFDVLLNPSSVRADDQLPVSEKLGVLRAEMETWLQANCNRASGTLKGLLKKLEVSCYSTSS